jgi:hypothetical protein
MEIIKIINYKNYFDYKNCDLTIFNIYDSYVSSQNVYFGRHLHLELCRLARELNLIFSMKITLDMACYLTHLTSLVYYLYWIIVQKYREKWFAIYNWFNVILWISVTLVRFYTVNYICENVTQKVR